MDKQSAHLIPADLDDANLTQLQSLESKIRDKAGSEVVLLAYRSQERDEASAEVH